LIRIIDRASFRSLGWIVVRQTATGERTSLAPARQAQPVNARLGPPCAAPQHRVATITGRRGFRPGGLVASGEIKKEGTHFSAKPQPPEVDTAKPTGKPGGQMGDYMIGDTPQHRIIGSVLLRRFFKPRCSGDPWLRSWPSFGCTNFNRLFSQRILALSWSSLMALSIEIRSRSILKGTHTVPLQHWQPIQG
jgi:hypothetical protein